jgi:hypothetical protein
MPRATLIDRPTYCLIHTAHGSRSHSIAIGESNAKSAVTARVKAKKDLVTIHDQGL